MSLSKVLETARADLGYTENPPESNMTKYGEAYGMNGVPWCVEALWFWFNEAGERMAFFGGGRTASCSVLLRWYKEQGLTVPVSEVQVGDIVLLNFHGGRDPEHCGLVTGISDIRNLSSGMPYSVWTIEGNTSPSDGSQSNGGMVCEKLRYPTSQVVAVCRPQYKKEEKPVDDVTGHWFTPAVEWAREKGLVKNYPDGSFKPNNPLTRAEACAMFERIYKIILEDDLK